jgi:hypothetical protein
MVVVVDIMRQVLEEEALLVQVVLLVVLQVAEPLVQEDLQALEQQLQYQVLP